MKPIASGVRLGKSQCRRGFAIDSVLSDVNQLVENVKMTAAQMTTGAQRRRGDISRDPRGSPRRRNWGTRDLPVDIPLFQPVVRCFAGDDDVVDVALAQTSGCDANEVAALLQFLKVRDTAISHAAAQSANELVN